MTGTPQRRAAIDELRRTTDSHQVIKGRRWRRTDPALDDVLRQHLVDELMDARRAVKSALADDDDQAVRDARARVNDAKIALGERGPKWWETIDATDVDIRSQAARRALGTRLGTDVTIDQVIDALGLTVERRSRPRLPGA